MKRSSSTPTSGKRSAVAAAMVLGLVGCGTTELEVDVTFDGTWAVTELASSGDAVDITDRLISLEIDTGEAAVRGQTACQALFGSYTLKNAGTENGESNGDASFTIPSPEANADCSDDDRSVHIELVEALESVTQWRREGPTLSLSSPSGSLIVLEGQTRGE